MKIQLGKFGHPIQARFPGSQEAGKILSDSLAAESHRMTGKSSSTLFVAVLLLTGSALLGQVPLTLQDAARILLEENPQIAAVTAQKGAADAAHRAARRSRLPGIQFQERLSRSNNPVFVFGSLLEQNRFSAENFALTRLNDPSALTNFRTSVAIQLPVLAQRKVQTEIESTRAGQREAGAFQELTRQQLLLDLISAYFGVALAEGAVEVTNLSVKTALSEVDRMRNLVEEGLVVKSDLLATEVQLAEFQQQQIQAQSDLVTARAQLASLLGEDPAAFYVLGTPLVERSFSPPELVNLQELASQKRPDLTMAEARSAQAEQALRAAGGRWQPSVQVFAEFGNSSPDLTSGSGDFALGGSLNFALLEPGRGERVQQARESWKAALATREATSRRVRLEVVQAWEAFRSAEQRLEVAQRSVAQAEETFRIVGERLQAGLTTITESLRAQTALQRARLNVLAARFDNYVGFARIRFAAGDLVDVVPFSN